MPKAKTPEEKKAIAEKAAATRAAKKAATAENEVKVTDNVLKNENEVSEQTMLDMQASLDAAGQKPAQNDNPKPNNGNAYAVNKPMDDYNASDGTPIRREATPEEEAAHVGKEEEEPRRLVIGEGPGNLMIIKWNRGGGQVPRNCQGGWNNKQRAQDAINAAHSLKDFAPLQAAALG